MKVNIIISEEAKTLHFVGQMYKSNYHQKTLFPPPRRRRVGSWQSACVRSECTGVNGAYLAVGIYINYFD